MDFSKIDMNALARQLRKPEGEMGKEVGKAMEHYNAEVNAFAIQCLEIQPTDHVLEIGFGPGTAIAEAVQLTPKGFVAGIDYSETMLAMAEDRNHRALMQEKVELTIGDAKELPYPDQSFDKVFAVNVFHFWATPLQELAECKRVLKHSGRILFYLTSPSSWPPGLSDTGVFIAREPEEIEELLRAAGFKSVEHRNFTYKEGKGFCVMGQKGN